MDELASAAGIAKGTFYRFFESKEDLCLAIFDEEERVMWADVTDILARNANPADALRELLVYSLDFVRSNSLLASLRVSGEYSLLSRGVRRERLAEHLSEDEMFAKELMDVLRERGARPKAGDAVVAGVLRAYVVLAFHVEEIGSDVFPDVMKLLGNLIASGLVDDGV